MYFRGDLTIMIVKLEHIFLEVMHRQFLHWERFTHLK